MIIMATHVDDLVWACRPEAEQCITTIKSMLTLGAESEYSFRYCGKEIEQDKETFSIKVTCRATTEKLTPIDMPPERLKNLVLEANEDEKDQLVTAVGILAWIARCCRPTQLQSISLAEQVKEAADRRYQSMQYVDPIYS